MLKRTLFATMLALAAGCQGMAEPTAGEATDELGKADRADCSLVKCALPLCSDKQHLTTQGGCCPVCVGVPERCATVLCAAVECPEGQVKIFPTGQCCGRCVPKPQPKECKVDADCPQIFCFACPCPYSECRGGLCFTQTPDVSTCGEL